jgi:hypothetical protein
MSCASDHHGHIVIVIIIITIIIVVVVVIIIIIIITIIIIIIIVVVVIIESIMHACFHPPIHPRVHALSAPHVLQGKKERLLCKHREANSLVDQINMDLTYSVCFNLANAVRTPHTAAHVVCLDVVCRVMLRVRGYGSMATVLCSTT